jgi:hypothetical protein
MIAKTFAKNLFIVFLLILAILSIYFGSYLPLAKSRLFIRALRTANEVKTTEQFKSHFDKVFSFYSPIGNEEVVKFLSSDIVNVVSQAAQNESVARELVSYIEPRLFLNNVRHLLVGAQLHSILWNNFHRPEDLKKAEEYYLAAFKIGPKLPPVLFGLLELYRAAGDHKKYEDIAKLVVTYWPNLANQNR